MTLTGCGGGHPSIRPNPPAQLSRQVCGGCPHRGPDRLITRSKHLLALRDLAINIPLPPTSTHHTTWPDAPTEVMNLYSRAKAEITPPTPLSAVEEECRSWVSRTILFLASSQIDERRCGIDHHHLDWSKAKAGAEVSGSRTNCQETSSRHKSSVRNRTARVNFFLFAMLEVALPPAAVVPRGSQQRIPNPIGPHQHKFCLVCSLAGQPQRASSAASKG